MPIENRRSKTRSVPDPKCRWLNVTTLSCGNHYGRVMAQRGCQGDGWDRLINCICSEAEPMDRRINKALYPGYGLLAAGILESTTQGLPWQAGIPYILLGLFIL